MNTYIIIILLSLIAGCVLPGVLMLSSIDNNIGRIKTILSNYEERRVAELVRKYIETGKID